MSASQSDRHGVQGAQRDREPDVYKRQVQAVAFRIVHAERYRHAAVSGKDDTVFVIDDIQYGISFVCHFLIVCLFFIHSVVICIFAQESNTIIV